MAIKHRIPITNGIGSLEVVNGRYNVTAEVPGYDNSTLTPKSIEIVDGVETYAFTISATGTLTINVTDTGSSTTGVQIVGAKFVRTDYQGNEIGVEAITDSDGNAKFLNVPFSANNSLKIYFKQVTSDGKHTFSEEVRNIEMKMNEETIEIANPLAPLKKFTLSDSNFVNILIDDGDLYIEENG